MLLPNKLYPFKKTVLKKSVLLLKTLSEKKEISVHELYQLSLKFIGNILEFQDAMDILFITEKIDLKGDNICYIK